MPLILGQDRQERNLTREKIANHYRTPGILGRKAGRSRLLTNQMVEACLDHPRNRQAWQEKTIVNHDRTPGILGRKAGWLRTVRMPA